MSASWRSTPERGPDVSRFRGCLLGSAAGGTLGKPVEGMSLEAIHHYFGTPGVTQYAPVDDHIGLITGDTQIALYTAEGLLRSWVRANLKGITHHPSIVAHAYLRWLQTQRVKPPEELLIPPAWGWLNEQPALFAERSSGQTTIQALTSMPALGARASNSSMGAAVLSRGLVAGLFTAGAHSTDIRAPYELGRELAAITHGEPAAADATGALATLTALLSTGTDRREAATEVEALLERESADNGLRAMLASAIAMAEADTPVSYDLPRFGPTHLAPACLAFAVYCLLKTESFADGLIAAVNHDGDSDTTGSIAGGLLGAHHGDREILPCWLDPLELRSLIAEVATDLYEFRNWDIRGNQERIWAKYPGY